MMPTDQKMSHAAGDGKPVFEDFGLWTLDSRLRLTPLAPALCYANGRHTTW